MKVAIAGASSGVGRHIAEAVLSKKTHTVIPILRRPCPELEAQAAQVINTDYSSVDTLSSALEGVHTVISAIGIAGGDLSLLAKNEVTLVHAAAKAGVKRFVPTGWAGIYGGKDDEITIYRSKYAAIEELKKTGMEWSFPMNGIFLNYFATPRPGNGHLRPEKHWIDYENCTATIPGDGNQKMVYTAVEDIGEFMARALDVEHWPKEMRIAGNQITLNELVKIGEKVRGKPFTVTYQTEEELEKTLVPNPPSPWTNIITRFSLAIIHGRFDFGPNELNEKINLRFTTAEEFIEKWWGGKSST